MAKFKFNAFIAAGTVLPLVAMSFPVFADDIDDPEDIMIVTASSIEQSLKDAPASVSVITAEQLEKNAGKAATDLADILEEVAGISKAIGTDVSSGAQIRGMPAGYTLILVDGKRLGSSNGTKSTQQNYFDDLNWIPLESIERIEIVRGPMSSLYGSDAMGGVINIITKKNKKEWGGSLTVGTRQPEGSKNGDTNTYTGTVSGPLGNGFSLRLNGSWNKRNADKSDTNSLRWGSGTEGKRRTTYGADLAWDINDNHTLTFTTLQGQEKAIQGVSAAGAAINLRGPSEVKRENYSVDYKGLFDFGSVKLAAYQNKFENDVKNVRSVDASGTSYVRDYTLWNKDTILEGDINIPFELIFPQSFTFGAQWLEQKLYNPRSIGANQYSDTTKRDAKADSYGIFAENRIDLQDNLLLTVGARYDHTDFGNEVTPRAFLVYHANDYLTFKGGYSEGFKAPTLRQSSPGFIEESNGAGCNGYADYTGGGCYTTTDGNLKPEKSKSWELGTIFDYEGWNVGATFFDNRFKDKLATDRIGYITGLSSRYWLKRVNLDTARTQGVEGNINIPLIAEPKGPLLNKLTWRNNFTRMIKAEDTKGVMLVTTPKLSVVSALDWQVNEKISAAFSAHYYSKMLGLNSSADHAARGSTATARIRNAYTIYGLSGQYRATKNIRFNAGIDNLFDKNPVNNATSSTTTGSNYFVPGRTFYASITTSF
jgi:outer membrane receptor for ferrienterochelin and colicins